VSRSKGVRTLSPWGSWHAVPADALVPYPVACSLLADRTQYLYLRRCLVCQLASPMFSYRKTCSNNCKGVLIGITRADKHTDAMRAASAEATSRRAELADIDTIQREQLDPIAAYRMGRRRGYRLGETRGMCRERKRWENSA